MNFPLIVASGADMIEPLKIVAVVLAVILFGYGTSLASIVLGIVKAPHRISKMGLALAALGILVGIASAVVFVTGEDTSFGFGTFYILPLPFSIIGLALSFLRQSKANKAPDRTAPSVTPPAAQEPRH